MPPPQPSTVQSTCSDDSMQVSVDQQSELSVQSVIVTERDVNGGNTLLSSNSKRRVLLDPTKIKYGSKGTSHIVSHSTKLKSDIKEASSSSRLDKAKRKSQ